MRFYSLVIPVYNRPQEVDELLESLTYQTYSNFEVIIVEDGSSDPCKSITEKYNNSLDIKYFFKENEGQGPARNFGFEHAKGDYFIAYDSDCIIPPRYLTFVDEAIEKEHWDAFGGPEKAHEGFTLVQKAITYSMTSPITTGGIRGGKKHIGTYHPRGFNMGISRKVFEKTGGFVFERMGEDIEFSIRIIESGFKVGLIEEAFVYHKRRTGLFAFYKQVYSFGRTRIMLSRVHPKELKLVHAMPAFFVLAVLLIPVLYFLSSILFKASLALAGLFYLAIFITSIAAQKNLAVACLSLLTSTIQLLGYGLGFLSEGSKKLLAE